MPAPFRIVFHLPGQTKSYYRRHIEAPRVNGIPRTKPEVTTLALDAAKFTSGDLAVTARNRFRVDFPKYVVYIEDLNGGGPLFERREVEPTTDDHRTPMWVVEDGEEETLLGFLAVPAWSPTLGRCYAIRSSDVPAIVQSQRHTALETVYGETPEAAVERAKQLWGPALMVPFAHPAIEAKAREEIRQFVKEIHNHENVENVGRPRPGDQRR